MKKVLSLVLCSIILFTCSLGLSGCVFNRENPFPYRGEYKELYTTAIYSIPDAEGYMYHGEGAFARLFIFGNRMITAEHYFLIAKIIAIKFFA